MREGNFNENDMQLFRLSPFNAHKTLYSFVPTNFLLYIRNIKNPSGRRRFMQICNGWKCEWLTSEEDQVLVYAKTYGLTLYQYDRQLSFEAQYYAGCEMRDGKDVNLYRAEAAPFAHPGYCWIFVPRVLDDKSRGQQTAATNVVTHQVNLPPDSSLTLKNLLTGEKLASFEESSSFHVVTAERSSAAVALQGRMSVSSVFLLTVDICPLEQCRNISFMMLAQALDPSAYQCFKRRQSCEYGMYEEDAEQEEACDESPCPSFDFFENLIASEYKTGNEMALFARTNKPKYNRNMCVWNFKGREKLFFCSRRNGKQKACSKFKKCSLYCFELRVIRKLCQQSSVAIMA